MKYLFIIKLIIIIQYPNRLKKKLISANLKFKHGKWQKKTKTKGKRKSKIKKIMKIFSALPMSSRRGSTKLLVREKLITYGITNSIETWQALQFAFQRLRSEHQIIPELQGWFLRVTEVVLWLFFSFLTTFYIKFSIYVVCWFDAFWCDARPSFIFSGVAILSFYWLLNYSFFYEFEKLSNFWWKNMKIKELNILNSNKKQCSIILKIQDTFLGKKQKNNDF